MSKAIPMFTELLFGGTSVASALGLSQGSLASFPVPLSEESKQREEIKQQESENDLLTIMRSGFGSYYDKTQRRGEIAPLMQQIPSGSPQEQIPIRAPAPRQFGFDGSVEQRIQNPPEEQKQNNDTPDIDENAMFVGLEQALRESSDPAIRAIFQDPVEEQQYENQIHIQGQNPPEPDPDDPNPDGGGDDNPNNRGWRNISRDMISAFKDPVLYAQLLASLFRSLANEPSQYNPDNDPQYIKFRDQYNEIFQTHFGKLPEGVGLQIEKKQQEQIETAQDTEEQVDIHNVLSQTLVFKR